MTTTENIIEDSQNIDNHNNIFFLPISKDIISFIRDKIIDVPINDNGKQKLQGKNNKSYLQFLQVISLYSYVYFQTWFKNKKNAEQKKKEGKENEIIEIEKFCSENNLWSSYGKANLYNYINENYKNLLVMELKSLNLYEDVKKNYGNSQETEINKKKFKFDAFKKFISPLFEIETVDERFAYNAYDKICFKPKNIKLEMDYRLINPIFLDQHKNTFGRRKPNFMIYFILSSVLQSFLIGFVNEVINNGGNYVLSSGKYIKTNIQESPELFKQKIEHLNQIEGNGYSKISNQAQQAYNKFIFSNLNYFINKPREIATKTYVFNPFNLKVNIGIKKGIVLISLERNPESEKQIS